MNVVFGAAGAILGLAAIIVLAVVVANKWAVAYLERHDHQHRQSHEPDFFRPRHARRRSHWG
jgi:hypothetical protein